MPECWNNFCEFYNWERENNCDEFFDDFEIEKCRFAEIEKPNDWTSKKYKIKGQGIEK